MNLPLARARCLTEIGRTVSAYRADSGWNGSCYIRLQVSRGSGVLGIDPFLAGRGRWTLLVRNLDEVDRLVLANGLKLNVATKYRRNPRISVDPASKTGNYMNNLLCLWKVRARGAADAAILNQAGEDHIGINLEPFLCHRQPDLYAPAVEWNTGRSDATDYPFPPLATGRLFDI